MCTKGQTTGWMHGVFISLSLKMYGGRLTSKRRLICQPLFNFTSKWPFHNLHMKEFYMSNNRLKCKMTFFVNVRRVCFRGLFRFHVRWMFTLDNVVRHLHDSESSGRDPIWDYGNSWFPDQHRFVAMISCSPADLGLERRWLWFFHLFLLRYRLCVPSELKMLAATKIVLFGEF